MIADLEQMTKFLEQAQTLPMERLFFADPQPEPDPGKRIYLHPSFRFIQPLTGEKEMVKTEERGITETQSGGAFRSFSRLSSVQ